MLAHVRVGQLGGPLPISQTMPWFFRQLSRRCSPAVPSCGSQAQSGEMWETHEDISYLPPMSAGCSPQGNACKLVPFLLCLLVNSYKYLDFRTCGYITFILPLRDRSSGSSSIASLLPCLLVMKCRTRDMTNIALRR